LEDPEAEVRRAAANALGEIGPEAAVVVSALEPLLRDPDRNVVWATARALGKLGKGAVPALVTALRESDDDFVRSAAALSLEDLGADAEGATESLVDLLKDDDPEIRRAAAATLGKIGPAVGDHVSALGDAVADGDPEVALTATVALGGIGSSDAAGVLIETLSSQDPELRWAAAKSLSEIQRAADKSVPEISRALDTVREDAWQKVGATDQVAMDSDNEGNWIGKLIDALGSDDGAIRRSAAAILGGLGEPARVAVPYLQVATKDSDPSVRFVADWAIDEIGRVSQP
jgi:HEAT repeat protein